MQWNTKQRVAVNEPPTIDTAGFREVAFISPRKWGNLSELESCAGKCSDLIYPTTTGGGVGGLLDKQRTDALLCQPVECLDLLNHGVRHHFLDPEPQPEQHLGEALHINRTNWLLEQQRVQ